jgi:hypothetical protein
MWRALNGPIEIELEGILRVYKIDQTTLFFDARSAEDFAKASLPGTHNVPLDQLATAPLNVVCFDAATLWHSDAAERAPSTASLAVIPR